MRSNKGGCTEDTLQKRVCTAPPPMREGLTPELTGAASLTKGNTGQESVCKWNNTTFASNISSCVNDPSAGSPTETLLRLLLPLSDKVH